MIFAVAVLAQSILHLRIAKHQDSPCPTATGERVSNNVRIPSSGHGGKKL